jgi:hypothetical protein
VLPAGRLAVEKAVPLSNKSGWSATMEDGLTSTQRQRVRDGTLDAATLYAARTSARPGARTEFGWQPAAYVPPSDRAYPGYTVTNAGF